MTLSDLAGHLELAPSTVHGIIRTLVAQGMVVQEHRSGRYQLGPAVLRLGNVYLDTLELRSKAIPWAETVLLHDHALGDQGADDAVNSRGRQFEMAGEIGEGHAPGSLQREEHPDRTVD